MNDLGAFSDGGNEFSFEPSKELTISRSDMSALAQAKSANYSGQYIALQKYGISAEEIDKLYLAGGFANYVNVDNAVNIGFIANIPSDKITKVGNASLKGATIMLISNEMRSKMEYIANQIEHIELETTADFFDIFVEGCKFNPMKILDTHTPK